MNQRGHVPMEVAERRLGPAGCVPVLQHIWDSFATPRALSSMFCVEVPRKRLRPEEVAMTCALIRQRHLFILDSDMRGHGRVPSAPIFIIPKTASKFSFIVNCTLGNKAYCGPMPKMAVPNLHTLRHTFMCWVALPRGMSPERFLIKLDLRTVFRR